MVPQADTSRFNTEFGSLAYRFFGRADPHRPCIVLLHEGLGSVAQWKEFPEALGQRSGCQVMAYSRLGYANSDPCPLPRGLDYMHQEAIAVLPQVLDRIDTDRLLLVGHSDGASISAIHAGHDPDPRIIGLVLIAPHFFTEQIAIKEITAARDAYLHGDLKQRLEKFHGKNTECAFRGWCDAWLDPEFCHWDITGYLSAIKVPVQLIQGAEDQFGTVAQLDTARQKISAPVFTRLLDNCRHAPHIQQTVATMEAVVKFIDYLEQQH